MSKEDEDIFFACGALCMFLIFVFCTLWDMLGIQEFTIDLTQILW